MFMLCFSPLFDENVEFDLLYLSKSKAISMLITCILYFNMVFYHFIFFLIEVSDFMYLKLLYCIFK